MVIYQATIGFVLVSCCVIVLLIPVLILQDIKIASVNEDSRYDHEIIRDILLCESLLFLWWFINFAFINVHRPYLSAGMIIMEVVYVLITLWFFATIQSKTRQISRDSIFGIY